MATSEKLLPVSTSSGRRGHESSYSPELAAAIAAVQAVFFESVPRCSIWESGFCSCLRSKEAAPGGFTRVSQDGPRPRPSEAPPAQLDIWDFMPKN